MSEDDDFSEYCLGFIEAGSLLGKCNRLRHLATKKQILDNIRFFRQLKTIETELIDFCIKFEGYPASSRQEKFIESRSEFKTLRDRLKSQIQTGINILDS